MNHSVLRLLSLALMLICFPMVCAASESETAPQAQQEIQSQQPVREQGSASVIGSFANDKSAKSELVEIEDQTKRLVMFVMGVPLLILLFATAGFGVAMGVYGKQVFVPHMVCAGLSLTLALGHAVVGIVWFYPF